MQWQNMWNKKVRKMTLVTIVSRFCYMTILTCYQHQFSCLMNWVITHIHTVKFMLSSFLSCWGSMNNCTCMCVHACIGAVVYTVFLCEGWSCVRLSVIFCFLFWGLGAGGEHLPDHLYWPPVTETIWSRCQNLIREWKRPREVQGHWNKGDGRAQRPFEEAREREEGRNW